MVDSWRIAFVLLAPAIALLFEGIRRRLGARMQSRVGPPLLQPFYDTIKLLSKDDFVAEKESNIFFQYGPFVSLLFVWVIFALMPFPLASFEHDFILMIYLIILVDAFYIVSGLASNSPFGIIGAMREMASIIAYEIGLAVAVITFFFYSGANSIGEFTLVNGFTHLPVSSLGLLLLGLVTLKKRPFDTPEAHPEIFDGAFTEYSGKRLAFLRLSEQMKEPLLIFLTLFLILGTSSLPLFFAASLALLFVYTFIDMVSSRLKVEHAVKFYMVVLAALLLELVWVSYQVIT